jgi:4-diphosphocytidyl-2-C-methyl-D-erythritol kinase
VARYRDRNHARDGVDRDDRVDKRIPQGADSAAAVGRRKRACSRSIGLWRLNLPRRDLAAIGVTLGADVPFFIGGEAAIARGIGETLTPVSTPARWLALATPSIRVSTKEIFAALRLTPLSASAKKTSFPRLRGETTRGHREVALCRCGRRIDALLHASPNARMTGSGACAFAVSQANAMRSKGTPAFAERHRGTCRSHARASSAARVASSSETGPKHGLAAD